MFFCFWSHTRLSDFGFAKIVKWREKTSTYCGTPHAMAPEILLDNCSYDRRVDWFSFGVLVYEMMMGAPPTGYQAKDHLLKQSILCGHESAPFPVKIFGGSGCCAMSAMSAMSDDEKQNERETTCSGEEEERRVRKEKEEEDAAETVNKSSSSSTSTSSVIIDFIRQCWRVMPEMRLGGGNEHGAKEIHGHAWMADVVDEVRHGLLQPPIPNPMYFSYDGADYDDKCQTTSTLTKEEQNMFADF